jgi:threonylcarbamoyladenosine tRNA methylthiotransferase MtaB
MLDGALEGLPPNVVVTRQVGERAADAVAGDVGAIGCVRDDHRLERVRAFVKIQDGCSFSCAFCVIPIVRGATRSRHPEAVVEEIRRRVRQGHREVVLTGVNLGLYRGGGYTLPRLVREAGAVPGLERLRLSSIEINHVDRALAEALLETPVVSRHLHVPLQAGDDRVLAAMGRRYTVDDFLRRLEPFTDFNITSDVIVGFPAEDDAAFERTLDTVRRADLTKVHVFPYSPRPGTRTGAQDTVPPQVKRARSERLRSLSHDRCLERWGSKAADRVVDRVLVDRPGRGYGDDYSPWLVDAPVGAFVEVQAVAARDEGIVGVPV